MKRIIRFSTTGKYYGIELSEDLEKEMEEIQTFVNEGTPVIIVNDLDDLDSLGIYPDEIEMIERDDST